MEFIIFILGTILGSFYLLVGNRLVHKEDIIFKRSHCDSCHKNLKWYELIPIISFIILGGKCSHCKSKISIMTFIIEVVTGILFTLAFINYGISYDFYIAITLSSLLILISITDFRYLIILDEVIISSIILISITQLAYLDISIFIYNVLSGCILFLFMLSIKKLGDYIYKRESMGGGDIKFAFVIGLTVGIEYAFFVLIISALLALPTTFAAVAVTKNKEVPYGPFLAGALLLVFLNYDKFTLFINYIIA